MTFEFDDAFDEFEDDIQAVVDHIRLLNNDNKIDEVISYILSLPDSVRNNNVVLGCLSSSYLIKGEYEKAEKALLQIDMNDPEKKALFEKGTHFNPVDLVCGLKNYKGEKYNLPDYVDKNTGFISYKSKDGRELKALELPGLWNGAMSDWNTVFVEVPIETFNPVKTVNDLLRPEHQ